MPDLDLAPPRPDDSAAPTVVVDARPSWRARAGATIRPAAQVGAGALAWALGGALALGLLLAVVVAWSALRGFVADHLDRTDDSPDGHLLASQIVPVWKRQVDAAREHSARSAESLLESFGRLSSQIDGVLRVDEDGTKLGMGAIERVLQLHKPQLDRLLATTRETVRDRDQILEVMDSVSDSLDEMVQLSKDVQAIARATHILSLNASVEATRAGEAHGGFNVIAGEIRDLAGASRHAGTGIASRVGALKERLQAVALEARRHQCDEEDLGLRAEEDARTVIAALIDTMMKVTRSSRQIHTAGREMQADLERIFVGLQSQDRMSQMLDAVTKDMDRFADWTSGADDEAAASPRQWLDRLEAGYTMEDQRSTHFETQVVEQQAAVEFF